MRLTALTYDAVSTISPSTKALEVVLLVWLFRVRLLNASARVSWQIGLGPAAWTNGLCYNFETMALSDKRILEQKKRGDIVIIPFVQANLNTSSYDVTLGEHYYREEDHDGLHPIYNIYNKKHTDRVWGNKALQAEKAAKVFKDVDFEYVGIRPSDKIILMQPGETILAHTQEFIGGKNHITTQMQARSTMGRNFIEVCKCAGWGDVGYINRWTMEITNNSRSQVIPLVVGRRVAQIVFLETGDILERDYTGTGNYQDSTDIKVLQKTWKPESMLPKAYTDRDIK